MMCRMDPDLSRVEKVTAKKLQSLYISRRKTVPFMYETLEAPFSGAVSTPDLKALWTPALLQLWIVWGK